MLLPSAAVVLSLFATPILLENDVTRVGFDPQRGGIVALVDKPSARDFGGAAAVGLYQVTLAESDKPLSMTDAARVRVERTGDALTITAEHETPARFRVTCRMAIEKNSPLVAGRIEVSAEQPLTIAAVRFPVLEVPLPLGQRSDDDAVLLPYCDGCLLQDPLQRTVSPQMKYPGSASLQMLAVYDPTAGLYLAARDAAGYAKAFSTRRAGQRLELSIAHNLPQTAVRQWKLPYDVALTTFRGTSGPQSTCWENAAELYRAWAVRQPWCRETLAQRVARGDVPKWLVEPSLFYAYSLRGLDANNAVANRLPQVVEQARAWRDKLGEPTTFMMMSWEKRGGWVTPDYFPPFGGAEEFQRVTQQLHAEGNHTLVFLSGLKWTLHKNLRPGGREPEVIDDEAEFRRRGAAHAVSDAHGVPLLQGKAEAGVGQCAEICPTTPLAMEILGGATRQCHALGIDCVQVDQIVGGGMPTCFHPEHKHPPGGGNWQSAALYGLFDAVRREAKARSRDYAFAIEEPGEFYIPLLDVYHARDYQQGRWPRSGTGILGVPLFTHVYHDYVLGYGGDSAFVSDFASPLALYHQGMNLVCGKTAGVAVWTRAYEPGKTNPVQLRMLRSQAELWHGPAREFLAFGRREASPPLDVPSKEFTFTEKDAKRKHTLSLPTVLHGQWRLPDGRRGCVLACVADQPVTFPFRGRSVTLEPGQAVFEEIK